MAKIERRFRGDFDRVLEDIHNGILSGSMSASHEQSSDFKMGDVQCAVRVYERYSWTGKNRVSLCVTLVGSGDDLALSGITSGGSQAMFLKINTWGEDAFLECLSRLVENM